MRRQFLHENVSWMVRKTAELMRKYAEKRLKEEKEMRELVQQVADGHKNSKAARNLTTDRAVKEVSEQSRELLSQALEEAQAELSRKMELICQIHASSSDKSLWMTLRLVNYLLILSKI
ncbi:cilia- and flagella-associated protein 99-like [Cyprinus carpio]|uniref:Cilia- and flagella-associated protein 99-like n=1 Tax=Cyprinus carpio TaxID=7962 RepID=A0A9Q9Z1H1_CYPCA|nr:cilia- and flagella-associated protein 99-like [Cyprinus carpio]